MNSATASQMAAIKATPTSALVQSLTFVSTAGSPSATPSGSLPNDPQNTGECELLGPFAILVQAALGGLALLSLVYKRWKERPQRPIKIWAFDASKQVFGSVLLHLANLVMSLFSAGQIQASVGKTAANVAGVKGNKYQPNPCSFYLLNLAIDTTIGIPILIVILRLLTAGASLTPLANPPESIRSGEYGTPPQASWWLKQSMIYFIGLLGMKSCVFVIFELLPWIIRVGDWALRWTEGNEAIQVAFVMLIFPLIMNALQYYIIDSFIKNNKVTTEVEDGQGAAGEDGALLADDPAVDQEEARKEDADMEGAKDLSEDDLRHVQEASGSSGSNGSGGVSSSASNSNTEPGGGAGMHTTR